MTNPPSPPLAKGGWGDLKGGSDGSEESWKEGFKERCEER